MTMPGFEARTAERFDVIREMFEIIAKRMTSRGESGFRDACQIVLEGRDSAHTMHLKAEDGRFVIADGAHPSPTTTITLPLATALAIAKKDLRDFDFRNPAHMAAVNVVGDRKVFLMFYADLFGVKWNEQSDRYEIRDVEAEYRSAAETRARAGTIDTIRRVEHADGASLEQAMSESVPFVIDHEVDAASMFSWTLDSLSARYRDVAFCMLNDRAYTIGEYIDGLRSGSFTTVSAHLVPRELKPDLGKPGGLPIDIFIAPLMWIGSSGQRTLLHRDPYHNFHSQIVGRKRWLLFAPDQDACLYPRRGYAGYQPCDVDPDDCDFATFPAFERAHSIEVILHPGETIVLPIGWFHHVSYLDEQCVSVAMGLLPESFRSFRAGGRS
jgi:hypothetical protein